MPESTPVVSVLYRVKPYRKVLMRVGFQGSGVANSQTFKTVIQTDRCRRSGWPGNSGEFVFPIILQLCADEYKVLAIVVHGPIETRDVGVLNVMRGRIEPVAHGVQKIASGNVIAGRIKFEQADDRRVHTDVRSVNGRLDLRGCQRIDRARSAFI